MRYTTTEAAEVLGVSRGRLIDLVSRGHLDPDTISEGKGRYTRLSREDIITAKIIFDLADFGMNLSAASDLAYNGVRYIDTETETWAYHKLNSVVSVVIDLKEVVEFFDRRN